MSKLECMFCGLNDEKNEDLGQLCCKGRVIAHKNCMYFSSGLRQNDDTNNELLGFKEEDIRTELTRGRTHPKKCVGCLKKGSFVGCAIKKCKKAGHLPCILKEEFLLQFHSNFRVYCPSHRPTQHYPSNATVTECPICFTDVSTESPEDSSTGKPLPFTLLLTPCCLNVLHRSCIQAQARSAGEHYFRCPVCNNQEMFKQEMLHMGIEIPTRDASWEICGQFSDLHFPQVHCNLPSCISIHGRNKHSDDDQVMECVWCGQCIGHASCIREHIHDSNTVVVAITSSTANENRYICDDCAPVYKRKRKCSLDAVSNFNLKRPRIQLAVECVVSRCVCRYGRSHTSPFGSYQIFYCYSCNRLLGHQECVSRTSYVKEQLNKAGTKDQTGTMEEVSDENRKYLCNNCWQTQKNANRRAKSPQTKPFKSSTALKRGNCQQRKKKYQRSKSRSTRPRPSNGLRLPTCSDVITINSSSSSINEVINISSDSSNLDCSEQPLVVSIPLEQVRLHSKGNGMKETSPDNQLDDRQTKSIDEEERDTENRMLYRVARQQSVVSLSSSPDSSKSSSPSAQPNNQTQTLTPRRLNGSSNIISTRPCIKDCKVVVYKTIKISKRVIPHEMRNNIDCTKDPLPLHGL